ncbi:MAG: crossover junction endodeoxyribonuclease RuvC [Deltaproteobacteria bacterium]|nr:crossover junction endodeoxyribonuclease RuvC [Deltaproteobacteria bacterium]
MKVLGIDPGTRACGWGVVASHRRRLEPVAHGVIRLEGELAPRLAALWEALVEVLEAQQPDLVAVEGLFTQSNARSALTLGHARGVVLAAVARAGLPVQEYAPATVKRTVAGSGRADKDAVQTMVKSLLGLSGRLPPDASDALAIAVCHLQHTGGGLPAKARLSVQDFRKGREG